MIHPYNETTPTIPVATTRTTPVPNLTYMQDLNNSNKSTVLASMVEGAQYYLKDARDEKEYCVSKLKDGNIWMTQNLDHDIVTADNYYTNQNTDIGWDTSTNSYATTTWTANKATYSGNGGIWDTSATGEVIEQSYDPGNSYITQDTIDAGKYFFTCWYENCDATLYDNLTSEWQTYFDSCDAGTVSGCDSSLRPVTTSETGNQHYHLGNFYNWGAAVALNDTSSFTVDSTDANRSICPSGWTLPRGGSYAGSGSVAYLYNQYGYSNHYLTGYVPYENPLYLSFSGEWYSPYSAEYGKTGYYWSGTSRDGTRSYYYAASASSTVSPNGYGARYQGFALRCIAR